MRLIDADMLREEIHSYFCKKINESDSDVIDNDILKENKAISTIIKSQPTVDAQEIIAELQMEKTDLIVEVKSLEAIISDLEEKCDHRESGEWESELDWDGWIRHECSVCGYAKRTDVHVSLGWDFCPECGSDMRGGSNENTRRNQKTN